ncbi:precorrin-3B C17-methyltransferase [Desulfacinum hydrothermale DSM 13146]|uniref:Precorrin-3B C17-methyltransferase n=1 Tax=Desulfacinum hydrothermale DSM 13146 TaxID=1121390 RepID=A0A1W1WXR0_9BACT|nr:precorrin-3B C(17)-methyltransferase [Desulfacinum hydrothermale]SMC16445.1 precorrin-3B C17-methyltransferase [Desulfacinum hydrothermale DSM 13146]
MVSLGPGDALHLTPRARQALEEADVIVGYKTYVDLIRPLVQGKEVRASGMKREIARCREAIEAAEEGRRVALVSSGDAGIYGMAGLVFDVCRAKGLPVRTWEGAEGGKAQGLRVEVVPGVAAFNAAAALLGAPLMHDFAAVSLSDHLTPWERIERRLDAAAGADFVIAVYNPRSKSRPDLLEKARGILLRHRSAETPVGVVRRAMREGQRCWITTLGGLDPEEVDMQTVLLVGNSRTYVWEGHLVTPRGYLDKYGEENL